MEKKELMESFVGNWGRVLSPFEIEDLFKWIDEDGMPVEVINFALRETVYQNKKTFSYLTSILRRYKVNNLLTVEKVEEDKLIFEDNLRKVFGNSRNQPQPQKSNIPDWVDKEYKHEATAEEQAQLAELQKSMLEE